MKPRFFKNLLCLSVAVVLACAAREALPGLRGVKIPWLIAVVSYYAARREAGWGFAAALWCGFAQDGLDGMGWNFGAPLFVGFWLLCVFVVKKQMQDNGRTCAVAAVGLALAHEAACFAALRLGGFAASATPGHLLARLAVMLPAAAAAAFAVDFFTRRADTALGNVEEVLFGQTSY